MIELADTVNTMASQLGALLAKQQRMDAGFIGIRTGGIWVAEQLRQRLSAQLTLSEPVGELDISFYRDDFSRLGLNPTVKPSRLPFPTEGRHLVLVDDVIMSGRTIRAAMNEIFDFGRPASILLVVIVDVGRRELPIQPDILGTEIQLKQKQRLKLTGPDPLALELRND